MRLPPEPGNRTSLKPLIVSAPFGNYLSLGEHATATVGTFTWERRRWRLWRILLTVRYNPFTKAWRNKIGLRNPGLPSFVRDCDDNPSYLFNRIVSIHGFNDQEWNSLIETCGAVLKPEWVELNLSCPNVESVGDVARVLRYTSVLDLDRVIVKVPPTIKELERIVDRALQAGITKFHATNTMPHPKGKGGVSGAPLLAHALRAVQQIRKMAPEATIIGGGGIQKWDHVRYFANAGADHVSIASLLFFPWRWPRWRRYARHLEAIADGRPLHELADNLFEPSRHAQQLTPKA